MRKAAFLILSFLIGLGAAVAASPIPFVNQPLVPDTAAPGGGPFTLAVSGGGFVTGAAVRWNGVALATQFVSNVKLTAFVPAADIAQANTANVTVMNPGTAVASNTIYFPVGTPSKTVYYNDAPGSPLRPSGGLTPLEMGDFNNDGRPDIACLGGYNSQGTNPTLVQVLLGNGDGLSLGPQTTLPSGSDLEAAGDFNGDGKLDLLTYNGQNGTATVLLGNGDGTFTPGPTSVFGVTGPIPFVLVSYVRDFNGDGKLDFLSEESNPTTGAPSGPVQVFFGNGDGTFTPGPKTQLPSGFDLEGVGDFNGDGILDIAIESYDAVNVMLGNGDGSFGAATGSPTTVFGVSGDVAVGDFNGDGKQDMAVPNAEGGGQPPVYILLGNGDGTFTKIPNCCGSPQHDITGLWIAPGDFNDDGYLDLALSIMNKQSLTNPLPEYIELLLGNGDGTFTPTDWSTLLPGNPSIMWIADMSGDGKLDFVTREDPFEEVSALLQGPLSGPAPDFTISAVSPSLSVAPGGTVTDGIKIADVGGYLAPVTSFTCTNVPLEATCKLQPLPGMILPTARAIDTMTIVTQGPPASASTVGAAPPPGDRGLLELGVGLGVLTLIAALVLTRGRPAWIRALALAPLAALVMCAALWAGCGASAPPQQPPADIGTPPGTYSVKVSMTAGSITHSTTIKLIVG